MYVCMYVVNIYNQATSTHRGNDVVTWTCGLRSLPLGWSTQVGWPRPPQLTGIAPAGGLDDVKSFSVHNV